jgi:hypothetical protein
MGSATAKNSDGAGHIVTGGDAGRLKGFHSEHYSPLLLAEKIFFRQG